MQVENKLRKLKWRKSLVLAQVFGPHTSCLKETALGQYVVFVKKYGKIQISHSSFISTVTVLIARKCKPRIWIEVVGQVVSLAMSDNMSIASVSKYFKYTIDICIWVY